MIVLRKEFSFADSFFNLCPNSIEGNGFELKKYTTAASRFTKKYLFLGRNSVIYELYLNGKKQPETIGLDKDNNIDGHGRVLSIIDLNANTLPPQVIKEILKKFEDIARQFNLGKIWIMREDSAVPTGHAEEVLRKSGYTLDNYYEKSLGMYFPIYSKSI